MIVFPAGAKVWIAGGVTDMRCGVDFPPELMGWIPPPDGIAMCQGDVG